MVCENCGNTECDGIVPCKGCGCPPCFDCGIHSPDAEPVEGRQGNYACGRHAKERAEEAAARRELLGE